MEEDEEDRKRREEQDRVRDQLVLIDDITHGSFARLRLVCV